MNRRIQSAGVAIVSILSVGFLYSWRLAPRWLETIRLRVALPGLPDAWNGLRIAHLSDFHAGGPGVSITMLREAKRVALEFQPDVVALTGDFYDRGRVFDTGDLFTTWPDGVPVAAVLGNHDFRGGSDNLRRLENQLRSAGINLLRNTAVCCALRGRSAWIAGVDDPHTWRADDEQAFDALPPGKEVLLYLAHSPSAVTTIPVGRVRLLLSGHTHGGQLRVLPSGRIPLIRQIRAILRAQQMRDPEVFRGVHWIRGGLLVISHGIGVTSLPIRIRTRPQVILIELAQPPASGPACDTAERYVERLDRSSWWSRWLS